MSRSARLSRKSGKSPVWMQIVHLLLADAVWISFVLLSAATLAGQSERSAVSGSTRVARHAGI